MKRSGPKKSVAVAGGKCYGSHPELREPVQSKSWTTNHLQSDFRFMLCMENSKLPGYVTEKIVNAFLSGAVPIYWGTEEIFNLFNKDAFIYYDPKNPQPAIDRILYVIRARSARILIISLFHVSILPLKLHEYHSYRSPTPQENQSKINARMHARISKNLTHASRSNTGTLRRIKLLIQK